MNECIYIFSVHCRIIRLLLYLVRMISEEFLRELVWNVRLVKTHGEEEWLPTAAAVVVVAAVLLQEPLGLLRGLHVGQRGPGLGRHLHRAEHVGVEAARGRVRAHGGVLVLLQHCHSEVTVHAHAEVTCVGGW